MSFKRFLNRCLIIVGVAVTATMRASIVSPDIAAMEATAQQALPVVFPDCFVVQDAIGDFLYQGAVYAVSLPDAESFQIYAFGTSLDFDSMLLGDWSEPHRDCLLLLLCAAAHCRGVVVAHPSYNHRQES